MKFRNAQCLSLFRSRGANLSNGTRVPSEFILNSQISLLGFQLLDVDYFVAIKNALLC